MLGPSRGPITSDRYVAGWRLLSGCLHRPTALHRTRTSPRLQAPLRSDEQQPCTGLEPLPDSELRCAPTSNSPALDSNLSRTPNELASGAVHPDSSSTALDCTELRTNSFQLNCTRLHCTSLPAWRFSTPFYRVAGGVWSFTFDLSPPAGSAPFVILIRSRRQPRTTGMW